MALLDDPPLRQTVWENTYRLPEQLDPVGACLAAPLPLGWLARPLCAELGTSSRCCLGCVAPSVSPTLRTSRCW